MSSILPWLYFFKHVLNLAMAVCLSLAGIFKKVLACSTRLITKHMELEASKTEPVKTRRVQPGKCRKMFIPALPALPWDGFWPT